MYKIFNITLRGFECSIFLFELLIIPHIFPLKMWWKTATLVLEVRESPGSKGGPLGPGSLDGNQRMNLQAIDSITYLETRLASLVVTRDCHIDFCVPL